MLTGNQISLDDGEFFGELLLQHDQPSPYAIEVTRDMLALFVQRTSFIEVIEKQTTFGSGDDAPD